MSKPVHFTLTRRNWYRLHGFMNVFMVFIGALFVVLSLVCLVAAGSGRLPLKVEFFGTLVLGVLTLLIGQSTLRSIFAIFSNRPYLTVSHEGISIDGGTFDRWAFSWSELGAFSPELDGLQEHLAKGEFVGMTFRAEKKFPRRMFSEIQHPKFHDIFELCGYFQPLSQAEVEQLFLLLKENIKEHQPFLISDWE